MPWEKEQWYPYRRLELKECNARIQRVRNVVLQVHPNKKCPEVIDWLLFGSLARKATRYNSDVDLLAVTRGLADRGGLLRRRELWQETRQALDEVSRKFRYEGLQFDITVADEMWLADPQSDSYVMRPVLEAINREGIKILTY